VLIWGSTWLVVNFQLGVVAPEVSIVYRYASATLILFSWAALRGLKLRFDLPTHLRFASLGVFLFSFNYVVTYAAQLYIPSALNAVVFSTMMWINVLNTRLFFGTRIEPRVYVGAVLGMLGLVVSSGPGSATSASATGRCWERGSACPERCWCRSAT
jgi:drug/metabolite transporter (DMT)-like permease